MSASGEVSKAEEVVCPVPHVTHFVGGFMEGVMATVRHIPDGHVLSVSVQSAATGNGHRVIQRESYLVEGGVARAVGKGGGE